MDLMQHYDEMNVRYVYAKVSDRDYGRAFFLQQQLVENTESIVISEDYCQFCIEDKNRNKDSLILVLDYSILKESGKLMQDGNQLICKNVCRKYVLNLFTWDVFNKIVLSLNHNNVDREIIENVLVSYTPNRNSIEELSKRWLVDRDTVKNSVSLMISQIYGQDFQNMIYANDASLEKNLGIALIEGICELFLLPFRMNDNLAMTLCQLFVDGEIEERTCERISMLNFCADFKKGTLDLEGIENIIWNILWEDRLLNLREYDSDDEKKALQFYIKKQIDANRCINMNLKEFASILVKAIPNLILFDDYVMYILPVENIVKYFSANTYIDVDVDLDDYIEAALEDHSFKLCEAAERIIGGYGNCIYVQPRLIDSMYKEYILPSNSFTYRKMKAVGMSKHGLVVINSLNELLLLGKEEVRCLAKTDEHNVYSVIGDSVFVEMTEPDVKFAYYINLETGEKSDYLYETTAAKEFKRIFDLPFDSSPMKKETRLKIGTFQIIDDDNLIYTTFSPGMGDILDGVIVEPHLMTYKGRIVVNLSKSNVLISYYRELTDKEFEVIEDIYGLDFVDVERVITENAVDGKIVDDENINEISIYDYFD